MKKTYKLIIAAIAISMALASCSDELITGENDYAQSEGSRVIAISFGSQTRTALGDDRLTPEFTGEDEWIRVSNSFMSENCKVVVYQNGRASITTSLTGALTAVYPASAAQMDGGRISGISISPYQDGTFASANICMAEMEDEKEESLTFHNKTALFAITPPEETTQLKVTSLRPVENGGARSGYSLPITTGQDFDAITITTTGKDPDDKVYLSLCPGVNLSDLSFEAEFATTGTGSIKGIPMKAIEEAKAENTTVGGTIYTINGNNWHEYVTINGVKWATMNIGASKSEEYGRYFAWGDIIGHVPTGGSFIFPTTNPDPSRYTGSWNASKSFDHCNAPYYDGKDYSSGKYNVTNNGKTELDLIDDAAYMNWGGAWHMPKGGGNSEFNYFISNSTWTDNYNNTNVSGRVVTDGQLSLFLPAAGDGYQVTNYNPGYMVHYWTRTLSNSSSGDGQNTNAYMLHAPSGQALLNNETGRFRGNSVRAIVNDEDSRMKKVIWENDGSHGGISWSGDYRFSNEERTTGEEIYAIPMDEWNNVIKSGTFYLLARLDGWAQVRITTGWWSTVWTGNDITPGDSHYTDNGDGTFLIEINFAGDAILDMLDEQHLLFTGGGYTPLELYYYAAPLKPAPRELVLWKGEAYADDFTNQPSFLDNYGQEFLAAGAKAGREVRFYITPTETDWHFEIVEGHWGWVTAWNDLTDDERNEKMIYRSYCSPLSDTEGGKYIHWDLDANGGYVPLTLTQEMLDVMVSPNPDVDWGGTFIGNGDNVIVTKITLLSEEN